MAASAAGREGGAMCDGRQGCLRGYAPSIKIGESLFEDKKSRGLPAIFCREEATRTPDPYVPNVVRYQLRYFSSLLMYTWIPLLRLAALFLWITPIFASLSILAKTAGAAA